MMLLRGGWCVMRGARFVERDVWRMMRGALVMLLLALFIALPSYAANGTAGSTAGNALLRGTVGARAAAMGGAYTAVADGPLALYFNPAGLSEEYRKKIFLQYDASILDISRSDLAMSFPLARGAFGFSASVVDYGDILRTTTTNKAGFGNVSATDYLFRLGYGQAIGDRLMLGGTLGYYRLDLDGTAADGVTSDIAALYRPLNNSLTFAAAVRNIGSRARFEREDEELPLSFVLGASYRPVQKLLLAFDYELPRNQTGVVKVGAEYMIIENLGIRVGYDGRNETDNGLTVGAGFKLNDVNIDYAFVPYGEFGQSHRVSAEVAFGAATPQPRDASEPARAVKNIPAEEPRAVEAKPVAAQQVVMPAPMPAPAAMPAPTAAELTLDQLKDRAAVAVDAGRFIEAAELYTKAVAKAPGDANLRYNLATAFFSAGRYADAADHFKQVTLANSRDEEAWLFLGYSESYLGRRTAAESAWRKVLELNPANPYASKELGR